MNINVDNAENILKNALEVLNKDMPEPKKDCQFCKWVESCGEI